jgi:hypothetical protein
MSTDSVPASSRIAVLTDASGVILAAARLQTSSDAEITTSTGVVPREGQSVHEVEVPNGTEPTASLGFLRGYRVVVENDEPRLVSR